MKFLKNEKFIYNYAILNVAVLTLVKKLTWISSLS